MNGTRAGSSLRNAAGVASVFFMLGLSAPVARAADDLVALQLEQLLQIEVTGVSRFAQSSRDAPSAVTVVTREQIRDHAWQTLADVLDSVPGLFVTTDRVYRYVGVRGFLQPSDYNTNVLLLIDGIPANDAVYNQAFVGAAAMVDLALVERIEFIPGPGSSVYGSNAILGVINVVTSSGRAQRGTTVETSLADHGGRGVALRHGYADDRRDLLLSVSAWHDDGASISLPDTAETSYGRATGVERERIRRVMARHAWGDFLLLGAYSERRKGYGTAPYGTAFGDPRTVAQDSQWLVALRHEAEWRSGLTLMTRASLGGAWYRADWAYPLDGILSRDDSDSRWGGLELQATDTRFARHTLIYGLEFRNQERLFQRYADLTPAPTTVYLRDRRSAHHLGVYVQDEWRGEAWRLNAGLRVDRYSSFGNTVNPRLGLIHELSPRTTLKYLFGTAYRAPNVFEMFYHDGNQLMKANPDLDPERIRSLELVVEHRDASGWQLRGSLFHNRIRDLIAQELDVDDLLVYRNRGSATVHGLTLAAERAWHDGTRLAMSSSWQEVRDRASGERLTHSPRVIAKFDLTVPFGTWRTSLEARHLGARRSGRGHVGAQTWSNLALVSTNPVLAGALLALRVDNLFDRRLSDPASEEFEHDRLPREGRNARLTLTWRF